MIGIQTGPFNTQADALRRIRDDALPEALKEALTIVALRARKAEIKMAKDDIDRPTPFALRSFVAKPGQRVGNDYESRIYVKTTMEKIFERLEYGGNEDEGRAIGDDSILNKYGYMNKNKVRWILKNMPRTFYAQVSTGTKGIWQREAGGRDIRLIVAFLDETHWNPSIHYVETAERAGRTFQDTARKVMNKKLLAEAQRARAAAGL